MPPKDCARIRHLSLITAVSATMFGLLQVTRMAMRHTTAHRPHVTDLSNKFNASAV